MSGQQWGFIFAKYDAVDVVADASDPNAVPPAAARVFRQKMQPGGSVGMAHAINVYTQDGTSLAVELWVKDETASDSAKPWFLQQKGTATTANGALPLNATPGALTFIRIVTNTGSVQRYGISQA